MLRKAAALAFIAAAATPSAAQQALTQPPLGYMPSSASQSSSASVYGDLTFEAGLRYALSTGTTRYTLHGASATSDRLSRLNWANLTSNAGEVYGRIDHATGLFLKGSFGLSAPLNSGGLQDEDFASALSQNLTYSSTNSSQKGGKLSYGTIDMGYTFLRSRQSSLGGFFGFQFSDETTNAYGCTQSGGAGSGICVPSIGGSTLGITNQEQWNAARIGLDGKYFINDRLRLSGDVALLPGVWMNGTDTHWLRIGAANGDFTGPTHVNATGYGGEAEIKLDYAIADHWMIGVGARVTEMVASGDMRFDKSGVAVTASQKADWLNQRSGIFVESAFRF